jgi:bifunctional non-homologous end joining protein LigD
MNELDGLPEGLVLDCELVAFNVGGDPDWPLLCRRVLHHEGSIPIHLMIFDLLGVDGDCLLGMPFAERRAQLEAPQLRGSGWTTPDTFDDGAALYAGVCERGLEGIIAKQLRSPYRPGKRSWIKSRTPPTGAATPSAPPCTPSGAARLRHRASDRGLCVAEDRSPTVL